MGYNLSPQLVDFLVRSASGGDVGLEAYLYELYPSFVPLAYLNSDSKPMYALWLQMFLIESALDKSLNLVDYFETTRNMSSDFTNVSKTIGDGQTDNYRNASSRMKDRENAWNRLEREGEEDTKNYHVSVSRSKGTEEGKSYDFSSTRNLNKGCSFDTAINKTEGKGDSRDYSRTVRSNKSLSKTANLNPPGEATITQQTSLSNLRGSALIFSFGSLNGAVVNIPDVIADESNQPESIQKPQCTGTDASESQKDDVTCEVQAPSEGATSRMVINWNWTAQASGPLGVSAHLAGGGEISRSSGRRTDQVCSSSSGSVNGLSYGHNNYSQTDSGFNEGRTKSWGAGNTLHNTGGMSRGERLNYGRSKGEVKGLIEFCSQTDSASRKRRVGTGEVDAVAKSWARTVTDSAGSSKKITNSQSSIIYWNQQVRNLQSLHKLLQKRMDEQHEMLTKQIGTTGDESIFSLCTFTAKADVGACKQWR